MPIGVIHFRTYENSGSFLLVIICDEFEHSKISMFKISKVMSKGNSVLSITLIVWRKIDRKYRYENQYFICNEMLVFFGSKKLSFIKQNKFFR